MNRKGWTILFVAMFLLFAATSSSAATITEDFEEVYDFDPGGDVIVRAVNGGIEVSSWSQDVESFSDSDEIIIRTVNGSVRLALPSDVSADLEASTVNGSIRTDFPLTVQGRLSKRHLDGKIKEGGGRISLGTVNGSVTISER